MNCSRVCAAVIAAAAVVWAASAHAAPVTIVNPSFELPEVGGPTPPGPTGGSTTTITGWVGSGQSGIYEVAVPTAYSFVPHGDQVAYLDNIPTLATTGAGSISQVLVDTLQLGIYTFSVSVGHRDLGFANGVLVQLLAGGQALSAWLDSGTESVTDPGANTWRNVTLVYEITAGNPYLGQALSIVLSRGNGGRQVNFDAVALDFVEAASPTPVPGALPLMGSVLGAGYLVARWRRRRQQDGAAAA